MSEPAVYCATVRLAKVYTCVTVDVVVDVDVDVDAVVFDADEAAGATHVAACRTFPVEAAHVWFPEAVYPASQSGVQLAPNESIDPQLPMPPLVGAAVKHP